MKKTIILLIFLLFSSVWAEQIINSLDLHIPEWTPVERSNILLHGYYFITTMYTDVALYGSSYNGIGMINSKSEYKTRTTYFHGPVEISEDTFFTETNCIDYISQSKKYTQRVNRTLVWSSIAMVAGTALTIPFFVHIQKPIEVSDVILTGTGVTLATIGFVFFFTSDSIPRPTFSYEYIAQAANEKNLTLFKQP